ncbi:MAG: tetratricopeptide repeat protein [Spirochaetales bacterium]|nr:tetratricopeptide repeat protein [Spirochaetales bacterium]
MGTQKKAVSFIFFLCISSFFSVPAQTDESVLPRIQPLPFILELAGEELPLPLDTAIKASLVFSDVPDTGLEQKQTEITVIIDKMKEYIKDRETGKEKAEGILHFLHNQVFKHYTELQTRVDVILDKGTFNCVSSAALYMLCVKAIGLDVWGIKTKDHAFCRVKTGEGEFDVETTNIYGFDPGVKKEFTDKFGNLTGYSYVPPGNYSQRSDISDLELLSLILQNRITYLNDKDNYYAAFELAIDLNGLFNDDNSFTILTAMIGNMVFWYSSRKEYEQGILFYDTMMTIFPNARTEDVRYKFVHNYVLHLLNIKAIDQAEQLITERNKKGLFKEEEYRELMIYIILDKANKLSEESYKDAVQLLDESIKTFGEDERLVKIKKGLINNWIAMHLNNENWDQAEELANTFIAKGDITEKQWTSFMSVIFNGRAFIIAEEKGYLEAAAYLKKALEILKNDKTLKTNYENYLYNYTVEIHNKVVILIKEKKYEEAIKLINEGLSHAPDSSLLKKDLEKIQKVVEG